MSDNILPEPESTPLSLRRGVVNVTSRAVAKAFSAIGLYSRILEATYSSILTGLFGSFAENLALASSTNFWADKNCPSSTMYLNSCSTHSSSLSGRTTRSATPRL